MNENELEEGTGGSGDATQDGAVAPVGETAPQAASEAPRLQPEFTGRAGEYFRIWIVNLVLSLLTLGIYSAWATVRNRRYFYGNTDLAGQRFDFHGSPVAILKGRLIGAALFLVYVFGAQFHWAVPLVAVVVISASFPWMLVQALRFRLANTSHRGLRFGFQGTAAAAYRAFGPLLLVSVAVLVFYFWTVGQVDVEDPENVQMNTMMILGASALVFLVSVLLMPVLWYRIRSFTMNHVSYGRHLFSAELRQGVFWGALGAAFGLGVAATMVVFLVMIAVVAVVMFGTGAVSDPDSMNPNTLLITIGLAYLLFIPAYLLPFSVWHCMTTNHVISVTRLENLGFRLRLGMMKYWWIMVSNAAVAVISLGMAIPWAKVRMERYRISCLEVTGDPNVFLAGTRRDPTATAEELGEAFDLDFGF